MSLAITQPPPSSSSPTTGNNTTPPPSLLLLLLFSHDRQYETLRTKIDMWLNLTKINSETKNNPIGCTDNIWSDLSKNTGNNFGNSKWANYIEYVLFSGAAKTQFENLSIFVHCWKKMEYWVCLKYTNIIPKLFNKLEQVAYIPFTSLFALRVTSLFAL